MPPECCTRKSSICLFATPVNQRYIVDQTVFRIVMLIHAIAVWKQLSVLDRLLSPLILLAMILGVILSEFAPRVREALNTTHFNGVSVRQYTTLVLHSVHITHPYLQ